MIRQLKLADLFSIFNATFGFGGIVYLFNFGIDKHTFYFLYLSSLMDGADGMIANKFGKSPFGKDLDSLADSISFGVFPGIIIASYNSTLFFPALLLVISSILRLARFNVVESNNFIGCPTVASALFLTSAVRLNFPYQIIFALSLFMAFLMISNLEYPKIRNKILLTSLGVVLLLCFTMDKFVYVLIALIVLYIISPTLKGVVEWKKL